MDAEVHYVHSLKVVVKCTCIRSCGRFVIILCCVCAGASYIAGRIRTEKGKEYGRSTSDSAPSVNIVLHNKKLVSV